MKKILGILFCLFHFVAIYAQQPRLMLPIGHSMGINEISISPDEKKLLSISNENSLKVWDVQSCRLLANLTGHTDFIATSCFSPDGEKIMSASHDGTVKIWNAKNCELIRTINAHKEVIRSAAFSNDGESIVTSSTDHTAKLWNIENGSLVAVLKSHSDIVIRSVFSPDGKFILTVSADGLGKIWDGKNGGLLKTLIHDPEKQIEWGEFSPDCKTVITVSSNAIKKWEVSSGNFLSDFKGRWINFDDAHFSPDGQRIVSRSGNNGNCHIWDVNTAQVVLEMKASSSCLTSVGYTKDGKFILTADCDGISKLWDANSGALLQNLLGHKEMVNSVLFSADGLKIITASSDNTIRFWESKTGTEINLIRGHSHMFTSARYSRDGKSIITRLELGDRQEILNAWDVNTGKLMTYQIREGDQEFEFLSHSASKSFYSNDEEKHMTGYIIDNETKDTVRLSGHRNTIVSVAFSPDDLKIVTASMDLTAKLWDSKSGKLIQDLIGHEDEVNSARFSPDGNKIVTASNDGEIKLWDALTGKNLHTLKHGGWVINANFSHDGSKIISNSGNHTAKIWSVASGKLLADLNGHTNDVTSAVFNTDDKEVLTASLDNTCKRWDALTGKLLCTFLLVDSSDYLTMTPAGYYHATQNAAKLLHYVTKDLKVISFEQLDIKYNRPDKVLEAIGNTDTALINSYKRAYYKRIKKLGIDTAQFKEGYSVPEAILSSSETTQYEQKNTSLSLRFNAFDSSYNLDRFNIWVNDVPVYGLKGKSILARQKHFFDTTISIQLSQGENRIETSVLNVNGTESYRSPLFVKYTPAIPKKEKVHFIGIGINQFANADYNLTWSVKDIRDLAIKLKEHYGAAISIDTLFDENVTRENVLALKQHLMSLSEDDKVIVSYSGHGVLSQDMDYFLSTYNISFEQPEQFGLPYDDLESLLDGIRPRKKLMFIDACHSGEVDKDEIARIETVAQKLDSNGISHKSRINIVQKKTLGMSNSFELMQNLFVNVGKSTGATIISAAGGMQYAQERGDLKNGVFTYSILEAFNQNKSLTVSQLKKIVGERVTALTNGLQKPTSRNETINVDWEVW
jgi:WD40 repeat protein